MFETQGCIFSVIENVRMRCGGGAGQRRREEERGKEKGRDRENEKGEMRIFFFYTIQQLLLNVLVFLDFYLTLISWELSKYYT